MPHCFKMFSGFSWISRFEILFLDTLPLSETDSVETEDCRCKNMAISNVSEMAVIHLEWSNKRKSFFIRNLAFPYHYAVSDDSFNTDDLYAKHCGCSCLLLSHSCSVTLFLLSFLGRPLWSLLPHYIAYPAPVLALHQFQNPSTFARSMGLKTWKVLFPVVQNVAVKPQYKKNQLLYKYKVLLIDWVHVYQSSTVH